MQNAKDTFYTTLQSRLAALNPARTIVVRGVVRPGTLVDENELPTAWVPVDAFRLQWAGLQVNRAGPLPLVAMECSIQYTTDGSSGNGGMDRGRLLAAMDAELASALGTEPHTVPKMIMRRRELASLRRRWERMCSGRIRYSARPPLWTSDWSGQQRCRFLRTRRRVSCEYNDDRSRSCGVRGSGDETGARLLRSGEPVGWCANSVRCGAAWEVRSA